MGNIVGGWFGEMQPGIPQQEIRDAPALGQSLQIDKQDLRIKNEEIVWTRITETLVLCNVLAAWYEFRRLYI